MTATRRWTVVGAAASVTLGLAGWLGGVALADASTASDRGWLGVGLSGEDGKGVLIVQVYDGSPAEEVGLESGDRIVSVDGKTVSDAAALMETMKGLGPGDSVRLTVENESGDSRVVTATLGEWPEAGTFLGLQLPELGRLGELGQLGELKGLEGLQGLEGLKHLDTVPLLFGYTGAKTYLGVELHQPSDQLRAHFGGKAGEGVLVNTVVEGSPAEKAGLQAGDLIVAVDGKDVATGGDVTSAIADHEVGDAVTVEVIRDQKRRELEVTLGENPHRPIGATFDLQKGAVLPGLYRFQLQNLSDEEREAMRKAMAEAREAVAAAREQWAEALRQSREAWRKAIDEARRQHRESAAPGASEIRDRILRMRRESARTIHV